MGDILSFDFECANIRIIMRGDEPWFVLVDVCRALEIENSRHAASRLDEDEKDTVANNDGIASAQVQRITIINESGLFSLILTSRKEAAKRFKKWVTAEVLPAIRRTGRYEMPMASATQVPAVMTRDALSSRERNSHISLCRLVNDLFGPAQAAAIYRASPLPKVDGAVAPPALEIAEVDGPGCLAHLLRFRVARSTLTVGEMAFIGRHDPYTRIRMRDAGVLANPEGWPGHVAIASQHRRLQFIYSDTPWCQDWRSALLTLPDAQPSPGGMGFGGQVSRAILLPWHVLELFTGQRAAA